MNRSTRGGWLPHLTDAARGEGWHRVLAPFGELTAPPVSLHLAILVEPYLEFILEGRKTIESRFSVRPMPPYRCVETGDVVLLKESGGPIVGVFTASSAWNYHLDPSSWDDLRRDFSTALCAQAGFWEDRAGAEYATLIGVTDVRRLPPLQIPKRDRRGWVVLADRNEEPRLL